MRSIDRISFIGFLMLLSTLAVKGQNLFLIEEMSYPCTNAIKLTSNSSGRKGLDVFLIKGGNSFLLGASTSSIYDEVFSEKLIIYLADGNVISCDDLIAGERVDNTSKALYTLSNDQVEKLKTGDIHTVKYTLYGTENKNYSASNAGMETSALIRDFLAPVSGSAKNTSPPPPGRRDQEPYTFVEQMPSFPNGTEAMYNFIYSTLTYPLIAQANGISGQVIVQFVVSAEGKIQQASVARGIGGGCNEEALRIVNSMPNWKPGKHNGINVPVLFTLPIKFSL